MHDVCITSVLWICFSLDIRHFKALGTSVAALCLAVGSEEAEACLALKSLCVSGHFFKLVWYYQNSVLAFLNNFMFSGEPTINSTL